MFVDGQRKFLASMGFFLIALWACFPSPNPAFGRAASPRADASATKDWSVFLPEDPAKALIVKTCSNCHDLARVVRLRGDQDFWNELVFTMITNGADIANEDVDPITKYLSTQLSPDRERLSVPININTAKPEALRLLSPIASQVDNIVKAREAGAKFDAPEDLLKIDGITKEALEKVTPFISVK